MFQITDENTTGNSDLPNVSLLVQTSNRNLKLTAPTREKHELWYQVTFLFFFTLSSYFAFNMFFVIKMLTSYVFNMFMSLPDIDNLIS